MKNKTTKNPVFVSTPEWRTALAKGQATGLAKSSEIVRKADGSVSFVASSMTADRYGDTIDQAGWETSAFEKNPVLLWAHSHTTPPVGKVGSLDKSGNLTANGVVFTSDDEHPFGAQVGRMVAGGFLNAVSVGFRPLAWEERSDEEGRFLGYHFTKMELLEISVVPVPANPEALIQAKSFARTLADWSEREPVEQLQPVAREWLNDFNALSHAANALAEKSNDAADADAFEEMLGLMREFVAGQKRLELEFSALRKMFETKSATPAVTPESEPVEPAAGSHVANEGAITDAEKASPLGGFLKKLTRG